MDELERRMADMSVSLDEQQRLEHELEASRERCGELERQVMESRRRQRREALEKLNSGRSELRQVSAAHDASLAALTDAREALRLSPLGDRPPEELEGEVRGDLARLKALSKPQRSGPLPLIALLCFVVAALLAAFYTAYDLVALIVGAAVSCVAAVVLLLIVSQRRRRRQSAEDERRGILKKYSAASSREIRALWERCLSLHEAAAEAAAREEECRRAFEQQQLRQSSLEEDTIQELDFSLGDTEAARLGRELAAARAETERLSARLATLNGRLSSLGDPLILSSALGVMREEYEQLQQEYDALVLAADTLQKADQEIALRFSPQLGKLAAEYMSAVTGGRYEDVLINRDFSARTRTKDDLVARDAEYLSAGTLDLMYLAVRLAVCELALPDGEPCPLILDDALVNLDEERFAQAMELLKRIARDRQVILFTCRQ